jgi:hypothetical protein
MRRSNLLIAFYLVLIFASGIVVGAFATHLYTAKTVNAARVPPSKLTPEEWRRQYTTEMQTRLSMTPDQMIKLNVVLDETGSKVHTEHERHNQEMKAIHEDQVDKTRALLTDVQRPQYEQLRKDREERAKKARGEK